jgi:hypothetical protein
MSLVELIMDYKLLFAKGVLLIGLALSTLVGIIDAKQAAAILSVILAADTYYEYKLSERIGWLEVELE